MDWRKDTGGLLQWVPPFRDLRIVGYLLLPEAFRSLSRLSSALSAKASTICSFYHDQNVSIALLTLASGSSLTGLVSFLLQKLYLGCLVFFFEILSCMRFSRYVAKQLFLRWKLASISMKIGCFIACLHATERTQFSKCSVYRHSLTDVLSVIRVLNLPFNPLITGKTSYQNSTALLIGLALKDCCPSLPVSILKAPAFFFF